MHSFRSNLAPASVSLEQGGLEKGMVGESKSYEKRTRI